MPSFLMLADLDMIGTVVIVVIGLASYVFDYMKKQKAEAEARRELQHELQQRQKQRQARVKQAAGQARRLEEEIRRDMEREQPRPTVNKAAVPAGARPVVSSPAPKARPVVLEDALPNLEANLPDAELAARNRMKRRVGAEHQAAAIPSTTEAEAAAALATLSDAEKAALDALRSQSGTSAAALRSPTAREGRHAFSPALGRLDAAALRQAVIYREILGPPAALKETQGL